MNAHVIDGKAAAAALTEQVRRDAQTLMDTKGIQPGLAVVIVGEDPASKVYVAAKGRMAKTCGFLSVEHKLPDTTPEADLLKLVESLNTDPKIHGIQVQLPLPKHMDSAKVIQTINPDKDVDGFHVINAGRIATGLTGGFAPCTPAGAMLLIRQVAGQNLAGLHAVVLGRSNIVGKPMANLLLAADCTVTIAHSRTKNLPDICRQADILVAAVGRPEMVRGDWVKNGAIVIDVGINRITLDDGKTKLVGDVNYAEAGERAGAITPVPGGVGPMTIAMLMANTLRAAQTSAQG